MLSLCLQNLHLCFRESGCFKIITHKREAKNYLIKHKGIHAVDIRFSKIFSNPRLWSPAGQVGFTVNLGPLLSNQYYISSFVFPLFVPIISYLLLRTYNFISNISNFPLSLYLRWSCSILNQENKAARYDILHLSPIQIQVHNFSPFF